MNVVVLKLTFDSCLSFHKILLQPHWQVTLKSKSLIQNFIFKAFVYKYVDNTWTCMDRYAFMKFYEAKAIARSGCEMGKHQFR